MASSPRNTVRKVMPKKKSDYRRPKVGNQNQDGQLSENHLYLKIFTWNVQRKGSPEEVDKLLKDTLKDADIICLQEANLPAFGTETTNFKWFCEGSVGSAILVHKTQFFSDKKVSDVGKFESICDQIKVLEVIKNEKCVLKVICCYIPPSTDFLSDELWGKLSDTLKAFPISQAYVLAGDFNAQIGKNDLNSVHVRSFGKMLHHSASNENGLKFKRLIISAHMKAISSTSSEKTHYTDCEKCYTFKDGELTSQQSYILGFNIASSSGSICLHRVEHHNHAILGSVTKTSFQEDKNASQPLVSTWNTKGKTPATVDTILKIHNIPVVCVQEVFLTSEQDILTDNYNWLCSKSMWAKNVGILVRKLPQISVEKFEVISDFLCAADLTIEGDSLKVISCHLPAKTHPKNSLVASQLTDLVKGIPKETYFVLAGDFNVKSNVKDSKEDNDDFLLNLVKDANLCMEDSLDCYKRILYMTSFMSDTVTGSPSQIIIPSAFRNKKDPTLSVKWVPFAGNAIVMMFSSKHKKKEAKSNDNSEEVRQSIKFVIYDGVAHKIRTSEYFEVGDFVEPPPLSDEIVEKYKNSVPNAEELGKILQDFVIFQDAAENSKLTYSGFYLLLKSFKDAKKFGKFILEDETSHNFFQNDPSRTIRIKWNGILLEEIKCKDVPFFKLKTKVANSLIRKLQQICYTIKGKKSFFNDGYEPMAKCVPKIKDVIREMVKKDFKSEDSILSFIDEFFTMDTDIELIFGPDFSSNFKAILSYAVEKDLKIRFFTSHEKPKDTRDDHIAISKRLTPQEIKDKLLKKGEDVRYILIPPCGVGEDGKSFFDKHLKEVYKQENQYLSAFWNYVNKRNESGRNMPNPPKKKINQVIAPTHREKNRPQQQQKPGQNLSPGVVKKESTLQQRANQPKTLQVARKREARKRSWQQQQNKPETYHNPPDERKRPLLQQQNQPKPSNNSSVVRKRLLLQKKQQEQRQNLLNSRKRSLQQQQSQSEQHRYSQVTKRQLQNERRRLETSRRDVRLFDQHPIQPWSTLELDPYNKNSFWNNKCDVQISKEIDYYGRNVSRDDRREPQRSWENDSYDRKSPWNDGQNSYNQERSYIQEHSNCERSLNERNKYQMELAQQDQFNRPDNRSSSRNSQAWNDGHREQFAEYPTSKRQKIESRDELLPGVSPPVWSSVAPLVLVWPITIKSRIEDRAQPILEANFHVEYQQSNRITVAAFVYLPLRNGSEKKFCLGVGSDQNLAAKSALNLIASHSTIIKPNPVFLCNGTAPNFIRYKVPCQTNPRTYIILSRDDTGPLTDNRLQEILTAFKESYNEDVFFDKDGYTFDEKKNIIQVAPEMSLKVRHFGDSFNLSDRYICVYKTKPQNQLLEEVLKMRGYHPKYVICTDRLPPELGLNIF